MFVALLTVRLLGVCALLFFFRLGGAIGTGRGTDDSSPPSKLIPLSLLDLSEFFTLAITSGSCKETVPCEDCDSSSLWTNWVFFDASSLSLLKYF
jgi:hypothetical protein